MPDAFTTFGEIEVALNALKAQLKQLLWFFGFTATGTFAVLGYMVSLVKDLPTRVAVIEEKIGHISDTLGEVKTSLKEIQSDLTKVKIKFQITGIENNEPVAQVIPSDGANGYRTVEASGDGIFDGPVNVTTVLVGTTAGVPYVLRLGAAVPSRVDEDITWYAFNDRQLRNREVVARRVPAQSSGTAPINYGAIGPEPASDIYSAVSMPTSAIPSPRASAARERR